MKIVHAADLHIDSPLVGLERYEGAPVERAREATRLAFRNVIDLTLREAARYLMLAGDVFDGDWRDANTGLFFVKELSRLRDAGCRVLLLRGNHDHELTQTLLYRLPDFVHVFGPPGTGAHTHAFERDGVAFHGVSYPQKKVTESLLPHYPAPLPDLLNVGLLHTNCIASSAHDRYAPCSVAELTAFGYGYWALGHVHAHQILARDPFVVYPGNTQGRHARETGEKGCVVIDTDGGVVRGLRFAETDVMQFVVKRIELAENDGEDDVYARVEGALDQIARSAGGKLRAVRLELGGATRAHGTLLRHADRVAQNIRSAALGQSSDLWVEKVIVDTRPVVPIEALRASPGLLGELLRQIEQLRTADGEPDLQELAATALEPLRKKLGAEASALRLDLADPSTLIDLLAKAETLLAERLTEEEG